jgi:hypothetical protein
MTPNQVDTIFDAIGGMLADAASGDRRAESLYQRQREWFKKLDDYKQMFKVALKPEQPKPPAAPVNGTAASLPGRVK